MLKRNTMPVPSGEHQRWAGLRWRMHCVAMRVGFAGLLAMMLSFEAPTYAADRLGSSTDRTNAIRIATWDLQDLWHRPGEPLRAGAAARNTADFRALREKARTLRADVIALQGIGSPRAARRLFPSSKYFVVFSKELAIRQQRDRDMLTNPARRRVYNAIAVRRGARLRVLAQEHILETADPSPSLGARRPQGQSAVAVKVRINKRPVWVVASSLVGGCDAIAGVMNDVHDDRQSKPTKRALTPRCIALKDQIQVLKAWKSLKATKQESVVAAIALPVPGPTEKHGTWATITHSDPAKVAEDYRKRRRAALRRQAKFKRRFVLTNPLSSAAVNTGTSNPLQPGTVALRGPSRSGGQRLVKTDTANASPNGNFIVDALSSFAKAARKSATTKTVDAGDPSARSSLSERSLAALDKLASGDLASTAKVKSKQEPLRGKRYFVRYPEGARDAGCRDKQAGANYLFVDRTLYEAATDTTFGATLKPKDVAATSKGLRTDCAVYLDIPRT